MGNPGAIKQCRLTDGIEIVIHILTLWVFIVA